MTHVIHILLMFTSGCSVMAAWDPQSCKDPGALSMCFKKLKEMENMRLPTDNRILEQDCRDMENASNCYHEYLDHCFNGSLKIQLKDKIAGVRETIEMLCNNETYKEKLNEHYACFERISTQWNGCGAHFYHKASAGPSKMCKAREDFIDCSRRIATEDRACSSLSLKQGCSMANFYANIIVPTRSCNTWNMCQSKSARLFIEPSLIVVVAAIVLAMGHI